MVQTSIRFGRRWARQAGRGRPGPRHGKEIRIRKVNKGHPPPPAQHPHHPSRICPLSQQPPTGPNKKTMGEKRKTPSNRHPRASLRVSPAGRVSDVVGNKCLRKTEYYRHFGRAPESWGHSTGWLEGGSEGCRKANVLRFSLSRPAPPRREDSATHHRKGVFRGHACLCRWALYDCFQHNKTLPITRRSPGSGGD